MSNAIKNILYSIRFVFSRIKVYFFITIISRIVSLMDFFLLTFLTKSLMNSIVSSIQYGFFDTKIVSSILLICLSRFLILAYNHSTNYCSSKAMLKHNDEFLFEIHQKLSSYPIEMLESPQALSGIDQAIRDSQALLSCFNNILNLVFSIISAISIIYLSFSIDSSIAFLTIAICIPSFFVNKRIKERNYEMEKRVNTSNRGADYFLRLFHIQLNNMEIKFYNLDELIKKKYYSNREKINKEKIRFFLKSNIVYFITSFANSILGYIIKLLIIYKIIVKGLTVGDYSLFSSYIDKLQSSVSTIFTSIIALNMDSKKIGSFLSYYNKYGINMIKNKKNLVKSESYKVKFENVTFKYPGTDKIILDNVSFYFDSTESVAFAGLNGAGKTTIIKLILRYYSPTYGKITINDVDINDIELSQYYKLFSVMFQDLTSYQISLTENIGLSESNSIDTELVQRLLNQVELSELKDNMQNTLGRDLDEDGIVLSRGQLQKLNLARALYKDAHIYILDEPSASVDALSEKMIFDKMLELHNEKHGIVLISHRLSHLTKISKIIYLSNAKVTEIGSHEELMRNNGEYKRLFDLQKSAYD